MEKIEKMENKIHYHCFTFKQYRKFEYQDTDKEIEQCLKNNTYPYILRQSLENILRHFLYLYGENSVDFSNEQFDKIFTFKNYETPELFHKECNFWLNLMWNEMYIERARITKIDPKLIQEKFGFRKDFDKYDILEIKRLIIRRLEMYH